MIWKAHHCLADGMSTLSFHLAAGDEYDVNNLVPIPKISLLK